MNLYNYFQSLSLDDIRKFVTDETEEGSSLEFKTLNFPNWKEPKAKDADKKNYSKCLSGFANSGGGIIIWGIDARNKEVNNILMDVAKELKPIENIDQAIKYLRDWEQSAVRPFIEAVEHRKILELNDDTKGYIISYVPESMKPPHMAIYSEKHYYKRNNDNFIICEHYDLADMFGKRLKPLLSLELIKPSIKYSSRSSGQYNYQLEYLLGIKNIGKGLAKFPYLEIEVIPYGLHSEFGSDGNRGYGLKKIASEDFKIFRFSGGSEIVVYPNDTHHVTKIDYRSIPSNKQIEKDMIIKYKIAAEEMELQYGEIKISKEEMNGFCSEYLNNTKPDF